MAARGGTRKRLRFQLPADTEPESDAEWREEDERERRSDRMRDWRGVAPRGVVASEAIRAFFKSARIREAAAFEVPEDLDDEEEAEAHELAASLAVKRLKALVGASWTPRERPRSLAELRLLRVEVEDLVARRRATGEAPPRETIRLDAGGEGERSGGKAGAKPLAKEFVFGAVASDVVARLHEAEAQVPPQIDFRQGDDVGAGIRMVPAQIRADLARAIGSNGRVDAAGEQCYTRTSIPRSTQRMAAALAESVQTALRAVTAGDESGLQYLSPAAAFRLAHSALVGEFKVAEFAKEMKLALNVASKGMCALDELRETWRLIKSALLAVGMALYGMSHCDEGVMQVDARINATAASLRLEASDLRTWLCRVLDGWACGCASSDRWTCRGQCLPSVHPSAADSSPCTRQRRHCG